MLMEKRRQMRLDTVIDGAFFSKIDASTGEMILTNVSRDGFRASLNRFVSPGRTVQFELRSFRRSIPVFATGTVVWVKEKDRRLSYGFDAGVRLLASGALHKQKAIEYDFGNWHMRQIAEYASNRGYLAKKFPEQALMLSCFLPSVFVLYVIGGALVSLMYPAAGIVYVGSIACYGVLVSVMTAGSLAGERGREQRRSGIVRPIFSAVAGRISTHLCYGIFFLRGLFSRRIRGA